MLSRFNRKSIHSHFSLLHLRILPLSIPLALVVPLALSVPLALVVPLVLRIYLALIRISPRALLHLAELIVVEVVGQG